MAASSSTQPNPYAYYNPYQAYTTLTTTSSSGTRPEGLSDATIQQYIPKPGTTAEQIRDNESLCQIILQNLKKLPNRAIAERLPQILIPNLKVVCTQHAVMPSVFIELKDYLIDNFQHIKGQFIPHWEDVFELLRLCYTWDSPHHISLLGQLCLALLEKEKIDDFLIIFSSIWLRQEFFPIWNEMIHFKRNDPDFIYKLYDLVLKKGNIQIQPESLSYKFLKIFDTNERFQIFVTLFYERAINEKIKYSRLWLLLNERGVSYDRLKIILSLYASSYAKLNNITFTEIELIQHLCAQLEKQPHHPSYQKLFNLLIAYRLLIDIENTVTSKGEKSKSTKLHFKQQDLPIGEIIFLSNTNQIINFLNLFIGQDGIYQGEHTKILNHSFVTFILFSNNKSKIEKVFQHLYTLGFAKDLNILLQLSFNKPAQIEGHFTQEQRLVFELIIKNLPFSTESWQVLNKRYGGSFITKVATDIFRNAPLLCFKTTEKTFADIFNVRISESSQTIIQILKKSFVEGFFSNTQKIRNIHEISRAISTATLTPFSVASIIAEYMEEFNLTIPRDLAYTLPTEIYEKYLESLKKPDDLVVKARLFDEMHPTLLAYQASQKNLSIDMEDNGSE